MKVRVIYDPILRRPAAPVTVFDNALKAESELMVKMMHDHHGMGLAANQIGLDKQLIVYELTPDKNDEEQQDLPIIPRTVLANPKILKKSQLQDSFNEGCLSIPGLELPVKRAVGVTVEAQNLTGKKILIKAKGLHARILQHEIDHINGTLFTDRANGINNLKNYTWAKIVFFGSDDFSEVIFRALIEAGLNVMAVVTETDKPSGRGSNLKPPFMKTTALSRHTAVLQPQTTEEITAALNQLQPDLIVLASYGKILPAEALAIPPYGGLNIHPSLLPKYRGATPIQSAILNNETTTGISLMAMNEGVDTGAVVAQKELTIAPTATYLSLKEELAHLGRELLLHQLPLYLSGQAAIKLQDNNTATKTTKLSKEAGLINWQEAPETIERKIRALNPWPGTYAFLGNQRLKILEAMVNDKQLQLKKVQLEGKQPVGWEDFQRGYIKQLKNTSWFEKIL